MQLQKQTNIISRGTVWEPENCRFEPVSSGPCVSILEQDTEPQMAPDEQVTALNGSLSF